MANLTKTTENANLEFMRAIYAEMDNDAETQRMRFEADQYESEQEIESYSCEETDSDY